MERVISIFNTITNKLINEINVDFIGIENLRNIFHPTQDDPDLVLVYDITEKEANELRKYVNIDFDFKKHSYQLDCFTT